jgi:EEF1A N-terminal glycine/lysine methyltransferase
MNKQRSANGACHFHLMSRPLSDGDTDPEDIFSTSLQTLYGYEPISHSSAGKVFTYTTTKTPSAPRSSSVTTVSLRTPDTQPANWALHASSVWVSSLYLADHIEDLCLNQHNGNPPENNIRVLELGAGAGLPSILIAKNNRAVQMTASDFPDDDLIRSLSDNVQNNGVSGRCRVVSYAWGTETSILTRELFDVIIACDTLWNPDLHSPFIHTLCALLRKTSDARVHLIAGLHTGRYTLQSFMDAAKGAGLDIRSAQEKEVNGSAQREWSLERAGAEDELQRRQWVVWMTLAWPLDCI